MSQLQRIEVHWKDQDEPLRCSVEGNQATGKAPNTMEWTPARTGAFLVECAAGKQRKRAMLQAGPA